jgi:UDP-2,3-diacylglucosamine hydrolase
MAVYFFSDAHLGAAEKEKEDVKLEKLYSLFDLVKSDGEKLYILGDLFDFWFEYKHAIPKEHLRVVFRLAALVDAGVKVHYITGNHDFWLGRFLSREVGLTIHRDFLETNENGKRIFVIHGDGLSPGDWKYRILKRILRNRVNIWLYRKIPTDWGIPLAKFVSSSSRLHTSGRENKFIKDYEVYAGDKIREGYDAVIIAHTHHPVRMEMNDGLYLNTGDFMNHFSYVRLNNGEFSLENLR